MKGRSLKPGPVRDTRHPARKKARPGSAARDRQRREARRVARLRKRERGPGCAIAVLSIIITAFSAFRLTRNQGGTR